MCRAIERRASLQPRLSFLLRSVRLDHFISTIQLPEMIELDTYARLQVHILHNEIRARLNEGNISSRKLDLCTKSSLLFSGSLRVAAIR